MQPRLNTVLAFIAVLAIGISLWRLGTDWRGVESTALEIGSTPATLYRPAEGAAGPPVVIAHGFAGSQQLMQSLALTLARNGYAAVTFDFLGHGRHPDPMGGDVRDPNGTSRLLLDQLDIVVARARTLGAGDRVALVGHSMASDIVVRYAKARPRRVAATVAISMVSPAADARGPGNLLILTGGLESDFLKNEALRAVAAPLPETEAAAVEVGRTFGRFADGTARRATVAEGVEHVGVLFARSTMEETARWLDAAFESSTGARAAGGDVETVRRGPWIALLLAGLVLLARPLASRLPALGGEPLGANLSWRQFAGAGLMPAVATPLTLTVVPTDFLALAVGDYLAAHFLLYGLLIAGALYWLRRRHPEPRPVRPTPSLALVFVALLVTGYLMAAVALPVDRLLTNFWPGEARAGLMLAMIVGALVYFTADEWLTRGGDAPRGAYWLSKLLFLLSLAGAIALDPSGLFFLAILLPVAVPVLLITGLVSRWCYLRTRHPIPAGLAGGVLVGWALGVVFPVMSG